MSSLNTVTIIGNLGRDPELRSFPSGDQVANISVATTDKWKDKATGELKSATEWHRVVLNGRMAEVAGQYLRQGSQVCIQGSLRTRKWTDNAGVEKYSTEIRADNMVLLGSPNQGGNNQRGGGGYDDGQSGGYDNQGYDQGGNNGGRQQPQQRQQQGNNQRQQPQNNQRQQGNGGGNGGGQQRQAQQQQNRGPQQQGNQQRDQGNQGSQANQGQQPRAASGFDDMDDDIPF